MSFHWPPVDPEGTFWRRALRVAIVLPLVLAAAEQFGPEGAVIYAVFGVIASLSMADFGGSPARRAGAYAGLAAFGLVNIVIGSLSSHAVVAGVIAAFVVGMTARLLAVFGGYWGMGTFSALLAFVLSVATPMPRGQLPDRLGGWIVGCVVATVAALTLWPRRPRLDYQHLVGDACRSVAARMRTRLPAQTAGDPDGVRSDQALSDQALSDRTMAAIDAARQWLLTTPYRPAGPAVGDRAMVEMTMLLECLGHGAALLQIQPADPVSTTPLVQSTSNTLERCARRLLGQGGPLVDAARALQNARTALEQALDTWVMDGMPGLDQPETHDDAGRRVLERAFRVLSCARLAEELTWAVEVTADGESAPIAQIIGRAPEPRRWSATAFRILRSHLSPRSAWFRQCLRTGVGLAFAVGIAMITKVDHGFWVVLGTLSVLRTSARATTSTAVRAVAGTCIGFVLAVIAIKGTGDSNLALWILLPSVAFAAVYVAGVVNDVWGQAGFTLMVVVVFDLIAKGGWEVGLVRIQTVAIGALVSVVVSALLWPGGAGGVVRTDVAAYYRSTAAFVVGVIDRFVGSGDPSALPELDRRVIEDRQRSVQAYSEYLGESPVHLDRWAVWARLLFVPGYVAFAARHIEHGFVADHPAMSAQVAESLTTRATSLGRTLTEAAVRVEGSGADEQVLTTRVAPATTEQCFSDDLGHAIHDPERARVAVTQVWIDCWLHDLDGVVAGLADPLAKVHATARSARWSWHVPDPRPTAPEIT